MNENNLKSLDYNNQDEEYQDDYDEEDFQAND